MSEKPGKSRRRPQQAAEAEADVDSDSSGELVPTDGAPPNQRAKLRHQKSFGWEVVEGLRDGMKIEETSKRRPVKLEGYLLKRRKWPMKGWHKRYFVLDNGLLSYAKSPGQLAKGRYHGQVDVGLSVVSYKTKRGRIDIDADTIVHHIKINDPSIFDSWVSRLKWHRLYRQLELSNGGPAATGFLSFPGPPTVGTIERPGRMGIDPEGSAGVGRGLGALAADLGIAEGETPSARAKQARSMSPDSPKKGKFDVMKTMTLSRDQGSFKSQRSPAGMTLGSNRLLSWIIDSSIVDKLNKDLSVVQSKMFDLHSLFEAMKLDLALNTSPRRQPKRFLIRRKRSDQSKPSVHPLPARPISMPTSTSNPNLQSLAGGGSSTSVTGTGAAPGNAASGSATRGETVSMTGGSQEHPRYESLEQLPLKEPKQEAGSAASHSLERQAARERLAQKEKFLTDATQVIDKLRQVTRTLTTEKEKIRQLLETQPTTTTGSSSYIQSLKNSLSEALMQNSDLRMRLSRIRAETEVTASIGPSPPATLHHSSPSAGETKPMAVLSNSLSRDSITEFFDAPEFFQSSDIEEDISTDSEGSDEDSGDSYVEEGEDEEDEEEEGEDVSQDDKSLDEIRNVIRRASGHLSLGRKNSEVPVIALKTGRRECLPAPQPDTSDFSLMNLLCRNIGRDLSRVRLPVILNEPLNALQRLCEELEYSELLDTAATIKDPVERIVYVAAFVVSGYTASFYRSGAKPFNPLMGETYELVREDKGWKFISEQVSHHPPISAMHCEADAWLFRQDLRIKNKFWGKSIEAVPIGKVHLLFPKLNEHYTWTKVTTCVHNIFGAQRYVEHYGDMLIEGKEAVCKLVFQKDNGWWGRRHEVTGEVWTHDKRRKQSLFGKWTEGLYCGQDSTARCVWRPGAMPEDHELYYGFTRFAIELNHLDPALKPLLPPTDTRLRPDQRLLEEGNVKDAEEEKMRVEELQRQRRKMEEKGHVHKPQWFRLVKATDEEEEHYEYLGNYWTMRRDPGFPKMLSQFPKLW